MKETVNQKKHREKRANGRKHRKLRGRNGYQVIVPCLQGFFYTP